MKIKDYIYASLVVLIALGLSVSAILYAAYEKKMELSTQETVSFENPSSLIFETTVTETESTTVETTAETVTEPATEEVTEETGYTRPADDSRIYYNRYSFTTVTPEYFNDAVFIGNSRLQGFILYSQIPDLTSYTYVGLSVSSYFTKEAFTVNGVSMTAAEALAATPDFSKVYLKFGINEIGWVSTEKFVEGYAKIIEHVYSCNPDAIIFINSVLPVSHEAIEKDPGLDNDKIVEFNQGLRQLAADYGAIYLDVAGIFVDEDGYMPYNYSFDGVHLNPNSVLYWRDYFLSHGIKEN